MNEDWNPITVGELIEVLSKLDSSMEISMVLRDEYESTLQKDGIKIVKYPRDEKPCVLLYDGDFDNLNKYLHGEQPC